MTAVTIETVLAKQAELNKLIEALQANALTSITIPEALIELAPGELYAGLVLNDQGHPSHHLILLPGEAESLSWNKANEWAEEQGGVLPSRAEQSLLFANRKAEFKPEYYWSGQQHEKESGWAWYQVFYYGHQNYNGKNYELRARAVRRLVIE